MLHWRILSMCACLPPSQVFEGPSLLRLARFCVFVQSPGLLGRDSRECSKKPAIAEGPLCIPTESTQLVCSRNVLAALHNVILFGLPVVLDRISEEHAVGTEVLARSLLSHIRKH